MSLTSALSFPHDNRPPHDAGRTVTAPGDYLALSESLKQLRGADFEDHEHPAVVLDRATGPGVRVWGWWAKAETPIPCMMWASERGWSVTVVEPGALDTEGYERAFWSHRVNLLDLALANALGPLPTLEQLELNVAADHSFGCGAWAQKLRLAVLWGITQQRSARANGSRLGADRLPAAGPWGLVDEELARHALVPALAKTMWSVEAADDKGVDALLRAVRRSQQRSSQDLRWNSAARPSGR